MICAKCEANVTEGRIYIRGGRVAGVVCHGCAFTIQTNGREDSMAKKNGQKKGKANKAAAKKKAAKPKGNKQRATKSLGSKRTGTLAAIIDPLLLSGGHTVKEIAAELAKKGGEAVKGKDLNANVRARMVGYTRKGW